MTNIDDDLGNADWMKSLTWDLFFNGHLVTELDEFLMVEGLFDLPVERQKVEVMKFLALPAAKAMPNQLRAEIRKWMAP